MAAPHHHQRPRHLPALGSRIPSHPNSIKVTWWKKDLSPFFRKSSQNYHMTLFLISSRTKFYHMASLSCKGVWEISLSAGYRATVKYNQGSFSKEKGKNGCWVGSQLSLPPLPRINLFRPSAPKIRLPVPLTGTITLLMGFYSDLCLPLHKY